MANDFEPFRGRASLVDRLVDRDPLRPGEARPLRMLNRRNFKASLRRDLSWLLNTRSPLPGSEFDAAELTVVDFGIPDFGAMSPANPEDRTLMARRLTRAVQAFEPRLDRVRFLVEAAAADVRRMVATLEADMLVGRIREPVSFRTVFHAGTGDWEVHDRQL
ncbi:MAG: type VI secretion system baseplate subunit TssE [Desulfococcaceae bacterium]